MAQSGSTLTSFRSAEGEGIVDEQAPGSVRPTAMNDCGDSVERYGVAVRIGAL